jgi:dCMP deaminase
VNNKDNAMDDTPHIISDKRWCAYGMDNAILARHMSRDPSTQVGAAIFDPEERTLEGSGWNGFPRGCSDSPELYADRETKYRRILHAEVNAIHNCKHRPKGGVLFVTMPPCDRCASQIIQVGIVAVVAWPLHHGADGRWRDSIRFSEALLTEAGVRRYVYKGGGFVSQEGVPW